MASGTKSISTSNIRIDGVLSWSSVTDEVNNRSTVTARLRLSRNNTGYTTYGTGTFYVKINGTTHSNTDYFEITYNSNTLMVEGSTVVNHNSDGSKSITIETWGQIDGVMSVSNQSTTATLDTIPRASEPTLNDYHVYYNDSFIIYTNRASSSFTHRLRYNFSGSTGTIATGVGTSYTWTLPASLMNLIPNATTDSGTIYCDTYDSGGSLVGTESVNMTGYVPSSVVPTISGVNAAEYFQYLIDFIGGTSGPFVQGKSKLKMTVSNPTGAYSSTIESFMYTVDGKAYSSGSSGYKVSDYIHGSGTLSLSGRVKDSRGRYSSFSYKDIDVLPYQVPKVTTFSIERANSDGTLNNSGDYVKVTRAGTWSDLGLRNNLYITLRSKVIGTTGWETKDTLLAGTSGSHSDVITVGTYAIISSYDFRLDLADEFNTTLSLELLSTASVPLDVVKDGIGVGKMWEQGGADVKGDVFVTDGAITGKFMPVVISANSDLNNITIPGMYYNPSNTDVDTMLNIPGSDKHAFSLLVEQHAGVKQTFTTYTTANWTMYMRNYYSGTWGAWRLISS